MKVLISAYACEPGRGSESAVGWNWAAQAARVAEAVVLTRANQRPAIEAELARRPIPHLSFEYLDLPEWARFWKRGARGAHAYYALWQRAAALRGRALHRRERFDLVHHLTFVSSFQWPGVSAVPAPFVWGPIGVNPAVPAAFLGDLGAEAIRDRLLREAVYRFSEYSPALAFARRRARRLIVSGVAAESRLACGYADKIVTISQNTIDADLAAQEPRTRRSNGFEVLMAGNMVSIKAFPLGLAAFARLRERLPEARLTVIGAGPLFGQVKGTAEKLGLGASTTFTGHLSRAEVLAWMDRCDAFLFPSFEGAGQVVLESMARALPVVCLDFGGPGQYTAQGAGVRVAPTTPEQTAAGLAQALALLAADSALYARVSAAALLRVRSEYLTEALAARLDQVYRRALAG